MDLLGPSAHTSHYMALEDRCNMELMRGMGKT